MTRRSLFKRLASIAAVVGLAPFAKAKPPVRPVTTVAATWGYPGYTDWSDGTRTVSHYYGGLSIETMMAMACWQYEAYVAHFRSRDEGRTA